MHFKNISRRQAIKVGAVSVAVPFLGVSALRAEGDQLDEADPTAMALGYVHDATAVDKEKFPRYTDDMLCSTCALYTGADGEEWGPCAIFPGKMVAAAGWCNSFAPKP